MKTPIALIVNCNLSLQFQTKLSRFPRPERRGEGIAGKDKFRLRNSFTLQMLQMRWNFLRNLKPSASSAILKEYHFVPWHVSFTVYFLCYVVRLFLTLQLKSGSCPGAHFAPPATFTQIWPSKNSVNFNCYWVMFFIRCLQNWNIHSFTLVISVTWGLWVTSFINTEYIWMCWFIEVCHKNILRRQI